MPSNRVQKRMEKESIRIGGNFKKRRRRRNRKLKFRESHLMQEQEKNLRVNRALSKSIGKLLRKKKTLVNTDDLDLSKHVNSLSNGIGEIDDMSTFESFTFANVSSILEENSNIPIEETNVVRNVHDLRKAILQEGLKLEEIELDSVYAESKLPKSGKNSEEESNPEMTKNLDNRKDTDLTSVLDHKVLELIKNRVQTNSKPGNRADSSTLALSIEGGGMRGAVTAGMASAIATLGLCDAFDSIYGSSAGSVVGAYMISRQMCVDVYTDLLPVARKIFVSKLRLVSSLIVSVVDNLLTTTSLRNFDLISKQTPAMNISFVLDGIMDTESGLRPLDFETFQSNDSKQCLRVVSSTVKNGKMETICFGSKEGDFYSKDDNVDPTICYDNESRRGLFACLQASMTVPGATGPPVNLKRRIDNSDDFNQDNKKDTISASFDAFCFEPLPYRSAVEEGATHVLVLRSRSECCTVKTKPGMYEKTVAPIYFKSNGHPQVAKYFEAGGQQYRYLEDVMTLDDGKENDHNLNPEGVLVPPTQILYGSQQHVNKDAQRKIRDAAEIEQWKRAHLLPIAVPEHKGELSNLENGKDEVLQAVRDGFAAAFDMLAPIAGLELDPELTGDRVAELIFPKRELLESILSDPLIIEGEMISGDTIGDSVGDEINHETESKIRKRDKLKSWLEKSILKRPRAAIEKDLSFLEDHYKGEFSTKSLPKSIKTLHLDKDALKQIENGIAFTEDQVLESHQKDAIKLLSCLPGIQEGKFASLSSGLLLAAGTKVLN